MAMWWGVVDAAQLGGAGHVQHLGKLAVLLGHPQAHVGAAGHHAWGWAARAASSSAWVVGAM
jgi:hypothetical protein